jgi:hypothetical protein
MYCTSDSRAFTAHMTPLGRHSTLFNVGKRGEVLNPKNLWGPDSACNNLAIRPGSAGTTKLLRIGPCAQETYRHSLECQCEPNTETRI